MKINLNGPYAILRPANKYAVLFFCLLIQSCFDSLSVITSDLESKNSEEQGSSAPISQTGPNVSMPFLPVFSSDSVMVHLEKKAEMPMVSFGVPLPYKKVTQISQIRILKADSKQAIENAIGKILLYDYDKDGQQIGIKSVLVQIPTSSINFNSNFYDVEVVFNGVGKGELSLKEIVPFSQLRIESPEILTVVDRIIQNITNVYSFLETNVRSVKTYTGWQPGILATFPEGYLASVGIVGHMLSRNDLVNDSKLKGMYYVSDQLSLFTNSAKYQDGYKFHPQNIIDRNLAVNYEAWLYDRCATFLMAYAHNNDKTNLEEAMRACSYYSSLISPTGFFTGKSTNDSKYSHMRGLYSYYALTGDESARMAAINIAKMWSSDIYFVQPYSQGKIRSATSLWTERLLGVSLEGLTYGFLFSGDTNYLNAAQSIVKSAYIHITTASTQQLNLIMQSNLNFPPQNCFIHNAYQGAEGRSDEPWCSGWMNELLIDPLLRYQDLTADDRVDEIFIRLVRFLRDTGSSYFLGNPNREPFLKPTKCYSLTGSPRMLVPAYGSGVDSVGVNHLYVEYDDINHCADATGLTAVGLKALIRQNKFNNPGVGPFSNEGLSFLALHHEFSYCAMLTFKDYNRTKRDPRNWKSSELASGFFEGDLTAQANFILKNKIGYVSHEAAPLRKLSWWFNSALLQFKAIKDVGIDMSELLPGQVQPAGCSFTQKKLKY